MFELLAKMTRIEARGDGPVIKKTKNIDIRRKSHTVLSQSTPANFIDSAIKWPLRQLAAFVQLLLTLNLVSVININTDCWWRKQKKLKIIIKIKNCFARPWTSRNRPRLISPLTSHRDSSKVSDAAAAPSRSESEALSRRATLGPTLDVEKVIDEESLQMEKKIKINNEGVTSPRWCRYTCPGVCVKGEE